MKRVIFGLLGFVVVEVLIIIVVTAFMTFAYLKGATTGEAIVEALLGVPSDLCGFTTLRENKVPKQRFENVIIQLIKPVSRGGL